MRKVIASEFVTLDGVVQAPSYPDEDVTGGFGHGGWHARYLEDVSMSWRGELGAAVHALKTEDGRDLQVIGSPALVRNLLAMGLVDELRLMIDPVVVGGGKRLFGDDRALRALRLIDSTVTSTGAIIATYATTAG